MVLPRSEEGGLLLLQLLLLSMQLLLLEELDLGIEGVDHGLRGGRWLDQSRRGGLVWRSRGDSRHLVLLLLVLMLVVVVLLLLRMLRMLEHDVVYGRQDHGHVSTSHGGVQMLPSGRM